MKKQPKEHKNPHPSSTLGKSKPKPVAELKGGGDLFEKFKLTEEYAKYEREKKSEENVRKLQMIQQQLCSMSVKVNEYQRFFEGEETETYGKPLVGENESNLDNAYFLCQNKYSHLLSQLKTNSLDKILNLDAETFPPHLYSSKMKNTGTVVLSQKERSQEEKEKENKAVIMIDKVMLMLRDEIGELERNYEGHEKKLKKFHKVFDIVKGKYDTKVPCHQSIQVQMDNEMNEYLKKFEDHDEYMKKQLIHTTKAHKFQERRLEQQNKKDIIELFEKMCFNIEIETKLPLANKRTRKNRQTGNNILKFEGTLQEVNEELKLIKFNSPIIKKFISSAMEQNGSLAEIHSQPARIKNLGNISTPHLQSQKVQKFPSQRSYFKKRISKFQGSPSTADLPSISKFTKIQSSFTANRFLTQGGHSETGNKMQLGNSLGFNTVTNASGTQSTRTLKTSTTALLGSKVEENRLNRGDTQQTFDNYMKKNTIQGEKSINLEKEKMSMTYQGNMSNTMGSFWKDKSGTREQATTDVMRTTTGPVSITQTPEFSGFEEKAHFKLNIQLQSLNKYLDDFKVPIRESLTIDERLLLQKIDKLQLLAPELTYKKLLIDDIIEFRLIENKIDDITDKITRNLVRMKEYYNLYYVLYLHIDLLKELFLTYNRLQVKEVIKEEDNEMKFLKVGQMSLETFELFCGHIKLNIDHLGITKIYYISSRQHKDLPNPVEFGKMSNEKEKTDYIQDIMGEGTNTKELYELNFISFLEALVRIADKIYRDYIDNTTENITPTETLSHSLHLLFADYIKPYSKKLPGFFYKEIIHSNIILQEIVHYYESLLRKIFDRCKIKEKFEFEIDYENAIGTMSFKEFLDFIRHAGFLDIVIGDTERSTATAKIRMRKPGNQDPIPKAEGKTESTTKLALGELIDPIRKNDHKIIEGYNEGGKGEKREKNTLLDYTDSADIFLSSIDNREALNVTTRTLEMTDFHLHFYEFINAIGILSIVAWRREQKFYRQNKIIMIHAIDDFIRSLFEKFSIQAPLPFYEDNEAVKLKFKKKQ